MTRRQVIPGQTKPPASLSRQAWVGVLALLAGVTLSLCSCRSLTPSAPMRSAATPGVPPGPGATPLGTRSTPGSDAHRGDIALAAYHPPALPANAWTGQPAQPGAPMAGPTQMAAPWPGANYQAAPWRPPGITGTWPADEYLFDGGDHPPSVQVMQDWTVLGLDQEDTVAHYDTLDGRTEVEASNRVPIYAPRFASVRQISGLSMSHTRNRLAGVEAPTEPLTQEEQLKPSGIHQPLQTERYLGLRGLQDFREHEGTLGVTGDILPAGLRDRFQTYEDFQVIRDGTFDNSEKARLTLWLEAAHAWESDQSAQVVIDEHAAVQVTGRSRVQSVYEYELPDGKPRLRIVKVASTAQAQPGDEIEFTLRFDNVGDQAIGNVTIIDNLTTRLEYVPGTAECSLTARFVTQENDGESLILRWEVMDPLEVGQGGIIRFRCRVR